MATSWSNVPCRFQTHSDENQNGDSTYSVWATGVYRDALINLDRDRRPSQVLNYGPGRSICYIENNEAGHRLVKAIRKALRGGGSARIADVYNNEDIQLSVEFQGGKTFLGAASRTPALGMCVMDFINRNGVISHFHPGHPIARWINEFGPIGEFSDRLKELQGAINRYRSHNAAHA